MHDMFTLLNEFALSWALAGMAVFFLAAVLWAFRPGSTRVYDEVARSILKDDKAPRAGRPARDDGQGA